MTLWQKGGPSDLPTSCCSFVDYLSIPSPLVQKCNGIRHALSPWHLQSSRAPEVLPGNSDVELTLGDECKEEEILMTEVPHSKY